MAKSIKIGSTDFWGGFTLQDSLFYKIIEFCGYEPIIDNDNPDILFYSVFGGNHFKYHNVIKIWFSGENWGLPNFNQCNFALSGYFIDDPRHYRLPLYTLYCESILNDTGTHLKIYDKLSKPRKIEEIKPKTKFCNFVYSNGDPNREGTKFRQEFFHRLSQYKQVDAGGACLNNIGGPVADKVLFISDYKFTIAIENSGAFHGVHGYTTEKIFHPMLVDSIPIHWGNPYIGREFNPKSIVTCHNYSNIDKVIERIVEIDKNDELYKNYLTEPFIIDHEGTPFNMTNLITYFKTNILNG
jgi:hypothetical protein